MERGGRGGGGGGVGGKGGGGGGGGKGGGGGEGDMQLKGRSRRRIIERLTRLTSLEKQVQMLALSGDEEAEVWGKTAQTTPAEQIATVCPQCSN